MLRRVSRVREQLSRPQWSPVPGTNGCIIDFGMQLSHGSPAFLTCCEPPPGLAGSHYLIETQMQRIPAGDGAEAGHARSLMEVNEQCPNYSNSGPVIRCPTPKLVSCLKMATVSKSLEELAREVARVGQRVWRRKRAAAGALSPCWLFLDVDTTCFAY